MALKPESETGSGPNKMDSMSISELICKLRDSFLSSEFDQVEEVLVVREERLKAELEEKKREIEPLKKKVAFERLENINAGLELKKLRQKMCGQKLVKSNNGFGLDGGIVLKSENRKVEEGVGEVEGGEVMVLEEKERGDSGLENGKERKVCEEVKEMVGINGSVPLKKKEGGIGVSAGGKLGAVIIIEDSDQDECDSLATLDKKETTSCTIIDNDHKSSSSGALQKNLLTELAESIGNLKRKFVSWLKLDTNIHVLDDLVILPVLVPVLVPLLAHLIWISLQAIRN